MATTRISQVNPLVINRTCTINGLKRLAKRVLSEQKQYARAKHDINAFLNLAKNQASFRCKFASVDQMNLAQAILDILAGKYEMTREANVKISWAKIGPSNPNMGINTRNLARVIIQRTMGRPNPWRKVQVEMAMAA